MTRIPTGWMDALEAAALLGVSRQRVHQIAHHNTGTRWPIRSRWTDAGNAGYWLYRRADVERRARKFPRA